MTCAETHGPQVAALSTAVTAVNAGTAPLCVGTTPCPTEIVRQHGVQAVEDSVFCDVMCCCRSASRTGARQRCVQETLDTADRLLDHQSRYKVEISYNMTTDPPAPFMHRGGPGQQRSPYWQGRAHDEIPGYRANAGMVRRPDIVVVRDPTQPPQAPNIERVIEQKFRGDPDDPEQLADYQDIAGPNANAQVQREESCHCGDENRRRVPFPVTVPAPQTQDRTVPATPQPAPAGSPVSTWVVVGLGIAAVEAVLSPLDGPVADAVAVPAFLGAWRRTLDWPGPDGGGHGGGNGQGIDP